MVPSCLAPSMAAVKRVLVSSSPLRTAIPTPRLRTPRANSEPNGIVQRLASFLILIGEKARRRGEPDGRHELDAALRHSLDFDRLPVGHARAHVRHVLGDDLVIGGVHPGRPFISARRCCSHSRCCQPQPLQLLRPGRGNSRPGRSRPRPTDRTRNQEHGRILPGKHSSRS